jgi:hypothetical protein
MFGAIFFSSANKVTECETYGIYPWSGSNIDFSWTPRAEILFFPILTSLGDEKNLCQRIWGKKSISLTVFGINSFYCTQCLNCICIDLFVNCLDNNNSWLFWILLILYILIINVKWAFNNFSYQKKKSPKLMTMS